MFIFDTPLARLDNDNRQNFIDKIISTISSQVVILSTDSEFVGKNLEIIENKIHNKYLLNYDVLTGATCVIDDYFGGAK
jgi:DNA sulfur modification protein DndD